MMYNWQAALLLSHASRKLNARHHTFIYISIQTYTGRHAKKKNKFSEWSGVVFFGLRISHVAVLALPPLISLVGTSMCLS